MVIRLERLVVRREREQEHSLHLPIRFLISLHRRLRDLEEREPKHLQQGVHNLEHRVKHQTLLRGFLDSQEQGQVQVLVVEQEGETHSGRLILLCCLAVEEEEEVGTHLAEIRDLQKKSTRLN